MPAPRMAFPPQALSLPPLSAWEVPSQTLCDSAGPALLHLIRVSTQLSPSPEASSDPCHALVSILSQILSPAIMDTLAYILRVRGTVAWLCPLLYPST